MVKKILWVQPLYRNIFSLLGICLCLGLFLYCFYNFDYEQLYAEILYSILLLGVLLFMLSSLYYLQYAIADHEKIIIKCCFVTIAKIKWSEIYNMIDETVLTDYSSNGLHSYVRWFIIFTDKKNREIKPGTVFNNRRNKPPYMIVASKRNRKTINEFYYKGKDSKN